MYFPHINPMDLSKPLTIIQSEKDTISRKELYAALECDVVERIATDFKFGGASVDIIVDEEGWLGRQTRGLDFELSDGKGGVIAGGAVIAVLTEDGHWTGFETRKQALRFAKGMFKDIKIGQITM